MENKVENKINSKKLDNQGTKFNVNIKGNKNTKMELLDFYNLNIRKLHIIMIVISIILYIISFYTIFSSIKSGNYSLSSDIVAPSFMNMIRENILLDIVIIIAGITPFCFLSIIGLAQAITVVKNLAIRYVLGKSFMVTAFLGGAIQLIGISLCVAVGLYYCRLATKKNKYYHHSDFGIDDIKMQLYEIRKNNKKVEELAKKKEDKKKKIESCNVKIPYLNFVLLGAIAFVIEFIGVLIALI